MGMDALISSLEEAVSSVDDVLAATTKAYSRRAYGEKAWKAAADFLVKQYGPVDAVKIMHHKAMRRAQDAASTNDVRSLVASVKSTVSTWPVKDILAESDETLDEGVRDAIKSVYNKFKEGFKKGLASRGKDNRFKGKPDYWRTVRGQSIGFTGSEGSGNPVIGPSQIISRMKAKMESMDEADRGGQQPLTTEMIFAAVTRLADRLGASVSKKGESISITLDYEDADSIKRYLKQNNLYDKMIAERNGKSKVTYTFGNQ